jgi:membrane protein CcdC involved in cytochrome C biogenesis
VVVVVVVVVVVAAVVAVAVVVHQRTPDQTYDIISPKAYDSTGMFGLSLRVVSTELSD